MEPTGFFVLSIRIGSLAAWPQSGYPDTEQEVIGELSRTEITVLGHLLGMCLVRDEAGDPIRVMDVLQDDRCADLMGHL